MVGVETDVWLAQGFFAELTVATSNNSGVYTEAGIPKICNRWKVSRSVSRFCLLLRFTFDVWALAAGSIVFQTP